MVSVDQEFVRTWLSGSLIELYSQVVASVGTEDGDEAAEGHLDISFCVSVLLLCLSVWASLGFLAPWYFQGSPCLSDS